MIRGHVHHLTSLSGQSQKCRLLKINFVRQSEHRIKSELTFPIACLDDIAEAQLGKALRGSGFEQDGAVAVEARAMVSI